MMTATRIVWLRPALFLVVLHTLLRFGLPEESESEEHDDDAIYEEAEVEVENPYSEVHADLMSLSATHVFILRCQAECADIESDLGGEWAWSMAYSRPAQYACISDSSHSLLASPSATNVCHQRDSMASAHGCCSGYAWSLRGKKQRNSGPTRGLAAFRARMHRHCLIAHGSAASSS